MVLLHLPLVDLESDAWHRHTQDFIFQWRLCGGRSSKKGAEAAGLGNSSPLCKDPLGDMGSKPQYRSRRKMLKFLCTAFNVLH